MTTRGGSDGVGARGRSSLLLRRQRQYRRLSVRELADAVGVTTRTVERWEAGTQAVSDKAFGRLLLVLKCDPQDLAGYPRGTEHLADLRRRAGMSTTDVVAMLAKRRDHRMALTRQDVRDLESGRPLRAAGIASPEVQVQLVRALAAIYSVPQRLVLDAWSRTRPEDASPKVVATLRPRSTDRAVAEWDALNERQQTYLKCVFELDQRAESQRRRDRRSAARGSATPRSTTPDTATSQWRLQVLALDGPESIVGVTRLQELLREEGVRDPGTGSSVDALARRGLILVHRDRVHVDGVGDVPRTRVEMTRSGRAAVRAALGLEAASRPPAPLLSEWLWSIVVRVAQAGEDGVDGTLAGRGPHFLAVGQSPNGRTPSRGFIELRLPDGVGHGSYRWFLTDSGRRHINDHIGTYRDSYPHIATEGLENLI